MAQASKRFFLIAIFGKQSTFYLALHQVEKQLLKGEFWNWAPITIWHNLPGALFLSKNHSTLLAMLCKMLLGLFCIFCQPYCPILWSKPPPSPHQVFPLSLQVAKKRLIHHTEWKFPTLLWRINLCGTNR